MKKKGFYIVLALVFGFILAEVFYKEYQRNLDDSFNAYLIQVGSFKDDYEVDPSGYLVIKEGDIYNVYAGVTTKLSNATKIKELYEQEDIKVLIKPTNIKNDEFLNNLKQFDILLSEVEDKDNVMSINDVIISEYEEIILGK